MATILCIETATRLCSVALGRDGRLLADRGLESDKLLHAEKLNIFIAEVLQEARVDMPGLQAVAVGIGPGSYTGLRIGLSAAKGLCFALRIPIIGIGTLEALAAAAREAGAEGPMLTMVDARRMEVFLQEFAADGRALGAPRAQVLDEAWAAAAGPCAVAGDGADKAAALWTRPGITHLAGIRPYARHLLHLAEERLGAGDTDDLAYLVPLYGKAANVTQPGKRRRG
ncbi:MAG: tRNA (adenosine(37)-N6)-threonylcarbamoyltransferase complex dimerization subunit type 1 TsaB [Flavobacteriales bacterium]